MPNEAVATEATINAEVRAFFEHPFHIVKNLFRHRKTRDRGLAKNAPQLHTLFGLANVLLAARRGAAGKSPPPRSPPRRAALRHVLILRHRRLRPPANSQNLKAGFIQRFPKTCHTTAD